VALDADAVLDTIGERLRAARERAGLTLDQAAERAAMSKAHLSRLESSERQPSIAALLSLSHALGVPVSAILGEDAGGAPLTVRPDGAAPRRESKGLAIASCSGYPGSSALEALRITVSPDRPAGAPARHRGEEWIYVLEGILRLEYDGAVHHLGPGATAHFDAERPHRLGAQARPAEIVMVAAKERSTLQSAH